MEAIERRGDLRCLAGVRENAAGQNLPEVDSLRQTEHREPWRPLDAFCVESRFRTFKVDFRRRNKTYRDHGWCFKKSRTQNFHRHHNISPITKISICLQTSELISEGLVRILKGDPTEKLPGGANPLLLGLSVFTVTRKCGINLGVKGWAELCVLVSSEAAMEKKNLDASLSSFQSLQQ